ncbi:MAG: KEOPS complex subunit Pcc1, partial [Thermoplasmata archaeon]
DVELTIAVRRRCASAEEARALVASVAADTPDYVVLGVDGSDLEIRLTARSAASARATLEDLFACLKAAERTIAADRSPSEEGRDGALEGG